MGSFSSITRRGCSTGKVESPVGDATGQRQQSNDESTVTESSEIPHLQTDSTETLKLQKGLIELQKAQAQIAQLLEENEQLKAESQKLHADWQNYHQQTSQSLLNMQTKLDKEREEAAKLRQEKQQLQKEKGELQKELSNRSQAESVNTSLPDLYTIRDQLLDRWKVAKRAESKQRLREFADRMIADVIKDDSGYTFIQRLLSDIEQERKFSRAGSQTTSHWEQEYKKAVAELKRRGVNWGG